MEPNEEQLYESVGILRYEDEPLMKLVVEVDPEISRYYRALIPKYVVNNRQMYDPHVSVVRNEVPPNMDVWKKYDGQEVVFEYSNVVYASVNYIWLNIFCSRLEEIRSELGLRVHSDYTIPPAGFNHCFHCTVANFKGLPLNGKSYSVKQWL